MDVKLQPDASRLLHRLHTLVKPLAVCEMIVLEEFSKHQVLYVSVCLSVCVSVVLLSVCMYICIYVHMCVSVCICFCVFVCVLGRVCMCGHIYVLYIKLCLFVSALMPLPESSILYI